MEVVRHENDGPAPDELLESVLENFLSDVGVQRGEAVIDQDNVAPVVEGARDGDSLFLTPGEIDPPFSDLAHITALEHLQVV